jgi:hypothetical protein
MIEVEFSEHDNFANKFASFSKKYNHAQKGLNDFKKIAQKHFHPINPQQIIGPGKVHLIRQLETYAVWKVEMSVKELRKNQTPRIWFAIKGSQIVFLNIGTHIENYNDQECTDLALSLASDFF